MKLYITGLLLVIMPTVIFSQLSWLKVSCGLEFSIALRSDHTMWSWGFNGNGQLGVGTTNMHTEPVQIGTENDWKDIVAGGFHCLAIKDDGTLWSWGLNGNGQLGINSTAMSMSQPVQVGTDSDWKIIAPGTVHSMAIKDDGTLWGWGFNLLGQLGIGDDNDTNFPVQVGTDANWKSVAAGFVHTLAVKTTGELWGWGDNTFGEIGNPTDEWYESPVQVGTSADWDKVAVGLAHSLALKTDGTVWSWGLAETGQLGHGNITDLDAPQQVTTVSAIAAIAAGSGYSFVLDSSGALSAFGANEHGQLGIGNTDDQISPVSVDGQWSQISAAASIVINDAPYGWHSLGIHPSPDNDVICATGFNATGQLGNGSLVDVTEFECETGNLANLGISAVEPYKLTITPNPSMGVFRLTSDTKMAGVELAVSTVDGKAVLQQQFTGNEITIDLTGQTPGVYFLTISASGIQQSMRLIVH